MEAEENAVSSEAEEYLEAIYRLERKIGLARTGEIARQLRVVPGSVTNTIKHLERHGWVIREPYKGVKLTEKGRRIALSVIRRHRLSERLLTDILRLDWSKAHDAACELEHAITDDYVLKALEKTLGKPKTCPHGNPIPSESGEITEEGMEPLTHLDIGEEGTVIKIIDESSDLLRYLATLNLMPGVKVQIEEKAPFNGPIVVKIMGSSYALGRNVASAIWVKRHVREQ